MTSDQFWSIFTMPIGVALCFGPAIVLWLFMEFRDPTRQAAKEAEQKRRL